MCITGSPGFQYFGHTRRATVKGDKGPEVAGVCVVESHKDCIEYHTGPSAEEGNEGRLLPPLDARVDRVHRLRAHVHTVTDGIARFAAGGTPGE